MRRISHIAMMVALVAALPACKPKTQDQQDNTQSSAHPPASPFDQYTETAENIVAKDKPGDIAVSTSSIALSPVSPAADIVLSATGATAPKITKIQYLGSEDVIAKNNCSMGAAVTAGGACTVHLTYSPADTELKGQLLIVHTGPSSPLLIPVTGEARAAAGQAAFDPSSYRAQALADAVDQAASAHVDFSQQGEQSEEAEPAPEQVYPMAPMSPKNPHIVATTPPRDMRQVISRFAHLTMTSQTEAFVEMDSEISATLDYPVYGGRNPVTGEASAIPLLDAGTMVKMYCHPARNTNQRGECYVTTLETPDNRTVDFKSLRTGDAMGRPGIPGDLDERYAERYGPGVFMSLLSAATTLASPDPSQTTVSGLGTTSTNDSSSRLAANQLSSDIRTLAGKVSDELAATSARLSIPKATIMDLVFVDDLYVPRPGEYVAPREPGKPVEKVARPKRSFDSISTGEATRQTPQFAPSQQAAAQQAAALSYAQLQAAAVAAASEQGSRGQTKE